MQYKPHDYQRTAITFLYTHPAAVLLLDMGLGKTVITLTALQGLLSSCLSRRVLVVAPKRVAQSTWPQEISKWDHLADLTYTVLAGSPAQRAQQAGTQTHIHIINRELLPWLVTHHGKDWPYDTVVIDELSSFKNAQSKRGRALSRVRPHIKRIIGLTGTPTPNGLLDLFGQYKIIDPTIFGTRITAYREKYFQPTKYVYGRPVDWQPIEGAEQQIHDKIRPVTLSMSAADHLSMPDLFTVNHRVVMPAKAAAFYSRLKRDLVADLDGDTIDALNAASLAGKLLQLANGALYTSENEWTEVHNAKLDGLEDLLEAANGQPLLVAYWYQHDLERIQQRFPQARLLDAAEDFQAWNEGAVPLGLIHPASAGHGLNLQQGGHLLVWYSLTWSLELYQQTNARLYRQGQTRPVTITHLVTQDTIDQRVLNVLNNKNNVQAALIDAVKTELNNQ
ncbi:SNF2-related protein [Trueperella bialowiezensis]|uniref:N-formylmethionyl-tRNA deformylase n=1 Tax=Trueperella bialowiezensis TaxID=312285 RepID=A0A3S4Z575_9ACTO|nr:DEAD/DEAH box helicase [Trueperella bialowiezensis]VEI13232.1 N-formylmethionyl-tRNA deformylase [Trueperella bialowiezensis]